MQPSFRSLIVHSLKTKELPIITGSPPFRPPRRPSAVRGCDLHESVVIIDSGRKALASTESVPEFEMHASKEWPVGRQASADDSHGWLQLTPHVRRRQRVCMKHVNWRARG